MPRYSDYKAMDFKSDPYWESVCEIIDYYYSENLRMYVWVDDIMQYEASYRSGEGGWLDRYIFRHPNHGRTSNYPAFATLTIGQFLDLWGRDDRMRYEAPFPDSIEQKGYKVQFGFPGFKFTYKSIESARTTIHWLLDIIDPVECVCGKVDIRFAFELCRCERRHPRNRREMRESTFMEEIWTDREEMDGEDPRYFLGTARSMFFDERLDEYEWMRVHVMPEWFRLLQDGSPDMNPHRTCISLHGYKGATPAHPNRFEKVPRELVRSILTSSGLDDSFIDEYYESD